MQEMKASAGTPNNRSSTSAAPHRGVLARLGAWWTGSRAVNLFIIKFVALVAVFHALTLLPVYDWLLPPYLHTVATLARVLSRCLGESGEVVGATLRSPAYAVTVSPACSAVELAGFIVAAVIAFPSPWRAKVSGVFLGVLLVAVLNVIRVTSLFLVGLHARASFDMVHEDLWAVLFILIATLFVGLWIARVHQRDSPRPVIGNEHA
jgi:exosortase/archaeosortase family protein